LARERGALEQALGLQRGLAAARIAEACTMNSISRMPPGRADVVAQPRRSPRARSVLHLAQRLDTLKSR